MQKIGPFRLTGVLCLCAVLTTAGVHALLGDTLLFQSDLPSLTLYIGAMALVVMPILAVLLLPLLAMPYMLRHRFYRLLVFVVAMVISTIFLMLLLSFLGSLLDIAQLKRLVRHPFWLFLICALPSIAVVWFQRNRDDIILRVEKLGMVILVAIVVGVPATVGVLRSGIVSAAPAVSGTAGKQLLLVVLDGMPAQHIRAYEPGAAASAFDALAERGLVLRQMRTIATWTHAYFGALYTAHPEVIHGDRTAAQKQSSLLARLQRAGIDTQWISYHRNGMPEGTAAHVRDYAGLRSYFLTENYSWLPEFLGLGYHVAIASQAMAQNLTSDFSKLLFDNLNKGGEHNFQNAFLEVLLPQLQKKTAKAASKFTIFHIGWNWVGPNKSDGGEALPQAQDSLQGKSEGDVIKQIRDNDYRYGPALEPLAERNRYQSATHMAALGDYLQHFLDALENDPTLRDTTIIVTADHGSMYAKGRFWYGYHANEEVARVPFIVLNGGRKGIDDRQFTTLDLTASILGFFDLASNNLASNMADQALSIFEGGDKSHDYTTTLTLRSDKNKEWFLLVVRDGMKYRINLHPFGDGETIVTAVGSYDDPVIARQPGAPPQIANLVPDLLKRYGIPRDIVHSAYQQY